MNLTTDFLGEQMVVCLKDILLSVLATAALLTLIIIRLIVMIGSTNHDAAVMNGRTHMEGVSP